MGRKVVIGRWKVGKYGREVEAKEVKWRAKVKVRKKMAVWGFMMNRE